MSGEPIRLFFWDMETKVPIRSDYIKIKFKKLNDDGEYAPMYPHAVGVKVEGFQILDGVKSKKQLEEEKKDA